MAADHVHWQPWIDVLRTPGVVLILPSIIPAQEIQAIQTLLVSGMLFEMREAQPGDKILITRGPLQSCEGTLLRHKKRGRSVVQLNISIMGRGAAVEVDTEDIQALKS